MGEVNGCWYVSGGVKGRDCVRFSLDSSVVDVLFEKRGSNGIVR